MLTGFLLGISARAETNPEPYDRVIIIAVDGAGTAFRKADTPNFDRVFGNGCITYEARATVPTKSAPGWGAMFYGVQGSVHGITNSEAEAFHKYNELYPSIFKLTKEAFPKAKVAAFSNWHAIGWGLIEWDCGVTVYPEKIMVPTKEQMVKRLFAYLDKRSPKMLFVYYGDLDTALHDYGYESKEYMEELTVMDEQIGMLYDEFQRRGLLDNTLILFLTDHGGKGTSHGKDSDDEIRCTFAAAGPRLETDGIIEDMELQDVAAIVLYALGIEQPEIQTARIPKGIFPGVGGGKRKQFDLREKLNYYGSGATDSTEGTEAFSMPDALSEKLVYFQPFESPPKGLSGERQLVPGLFGNALEMKTSYLKTGVKSSTKWKGMTICFWFKDNGEEGDPVFVTDKNWEKGEYKGFAIAKKGDRIQVNIGCGTKYRKEILWNLPEGYKGKWIHCLAVFDQASKEVRLYCDFEYVGKASLLPPKRSGWVTGNVIVAGQDKTGKYRYNMNAEMDDLMIFNQALTEEEIGEIKDAYDPFFRDGEQ